MHCLIEGYIYKYKYLHKNNNIYNIYIIHIYIIKNTKPLNPDHFVVGEYIRNPPLNLLQLRYTQRCGSGSNPREPYWNWRQPPFKKNTVTGSDLQGKPEAGSGSWEC